MHFFGRIVPLDMPARCAIICLAPISHYHCRHSRNTKNLTGYSKVHHSSDPTSRQTLLSHPTYHEATCTAITRLYIIHSLTRQRGPTGEKCRQCRLRADGVKFLVRNMKASSGLVTFVEYESIPLAGLWFCPRCRRVNML
jgi:hypothetical protein